MVAKKTKKFVVVLVLLIAWFSLIFWSMIMLLWWNQVVVTDQTEKTWNTTEETDVFKEMSKKIEEQEKEWALALTWHNNVYKEDEQLQNKLQELNVSLEKLDDQEQTNEKETKLNKEEIIEKFRNGEQDFVEFWINKPGLFIYISYSAVKDENGKFRGILEMMQDCTKIRSLEGSQTLLNWESANSTNKSVEEKEEKNDVKIDLDKIDGNTYLKDLIKVYPKLKEDMIKISENFKLLQTPLAAVMLPTVTLKKASERGEVELNTLIEKIKELIKTY